MLPYFVIGGYALPAFGVLVSVGFLAGFVWTALAARKQGFPLQRVEGVMMMSILGGVLGARLLYALIHPELFVETPSDLLRLWKGGMVSVGGFAGAAAAVAIYVRYHRLSFVTVADLVIPGALLGQGIGRWGCLCVGDDYGTPTDVAWAITFPDVEGSLMAEELIGVPLHPTQIYLSLNALALFVLAATVAKRQKRPGGVLVVGLLGYGGTRFLLEFYRGDDEARVLYGALSTAQWAALVFIALGTFVQWRRLSAARALDREAVS